MLKYQKAGSGLLADLRRMSAVACAVADISGSRPINLPGSLLLGMSMLACDLARLAPNGSCFAPLQGISAALVLPMFIGIISQAVRSGQVCKVGVSCISLSQVSGFMVGSVLDGVILRLWVGERATTSVHLSRSSLLPLADLRFQNLVVRRAFGLSVKRLRKKSTGLVLLLRALRWHFLHMSPSVSSIL